MKKISQKIIEDFNKKDEDAFNEIYKVYKDVVFFMVYTHLHERDVAEDIVQEVFIDVFKYSDKMINQKVLTTWVNKITYSKCLDYIRKQENKKIYNSDDMSTIEDTSIDSDIVDVVNRKYINEIIQESILKMNNELKVVGLLRFYEQLSLKDISEILDIPIGTVKSRLNTVKSKLKDDLKERGVYKTMSIPFLMPIALKGAYKNIVTESTSNHQYLSQLKVISLIIAASVFALAGTYMIKANPDHITNNSYISVNQEYINTSLPINIKTDMDYDYYLINGERKEEIESNGEYKISLIKDQKEVYTQNLSINNIDKEIPKIIECKENNGYIYVQVKDNLSGIDESSIKCQSNNLSINFTFNKEGIIKIKATSNQKYNMQIFDYAGNEVKVELRIREE